MQNWQWGGLAAIVALAGFGAAFVHFTSADMAHGHAEHGGVAHAEMFAAGEPADPNKGFRVVELAMTEGSGTMAFTPDAIDVKTGEQIKFVIKNTGALDHEFKLDSNEQIAKHKIAMAKNPEMIHDDPNGTRLQPSKSGEIFWKFSKAGTFEFACLIPGHYEAGMHGKVVVK
ncbi:cupredoxin domain-containing protein [Hyphomicrobium sp. 2TAF46]|uniref:cupredoxin domain-containing protein n=1 Tax=Hyphomicrobium sp. 2TAF46 TaxID=3233019 RepID=UPI003F92DFD0